MTNHGFEVWGKAGKILLTAALVFQLSGCGTLLYPERRGQRAGHLDTGVVILDGLGLLLFLIPGIIAFAVDFSNGTIYLPATSSRAGISGGMREVKFDPHHTDLAQLQKIIKQQTGRDVLLTKTNVEVMYLSSSKDIKPQLAKAVSMLHHQQG